MNVLLGESQSNPTGTSHPVQLGCASRFNNHECVILVCPVRSRVRTTSSRLMADLDFLITGLISFSL